VREWDARLRDFRILLAGQVVSALGTRVSGIATPLLALAITGSALETGVVEFAGTLPILLLTLYAGVAVDRYDRKRMMLACEAARALALASIAVGVLAGVVSFGQLAVVAFIDGAAFTIFEVAQRAALRQLVPVDRLSHAASLNQRREYGAMLLGTPLGGALYGVGRAIPFAADAVSYAVSFFSDILISRPLNERRAQPATTGKVHAEIVEGLRWVWREPFLRTNSILVTASDLTVNSLYLVVVVVARRHGASSALVGGMLLFLGLGGVIGTLIAPRLLRTVPLKAGIYGTLVTITALLPIVATVHDPLILGLVYGTMFIPYPTWGAGLSAYRAARIPDEIQGRAQSVFTLLSLGAVPFGMLATGASLQHFGGSATALGLFAVMSTATLYALASVHIRHSPRLADSTLNAVGA
jgi:MFS family permease